MADRRRRHDQRVSIGLPSYEFIITPEDQKGWDQFQQFLGDMDKIMVPSFERGVKIFAKEILDIVKNSLGSGKPPKGTKWDPHSPATIKRHNKGQDYPLLNLTGTYERSVGIFERRGRVLVGLPPGARASGGKKRNGKITLNALAIIQEYGSGVGRAEQGTRIPARPLWAPAFKQAGGYDRIRRLVFEDLETRVGRALNSYQDTYKRTGGKGKLTFPKMPKRRK